MNTAAALLDPPTCEPDTFTDEDEYNAWLRADIAARLANPGPLIPHDEVMADLDRIIDEIEATGAH